MPTATLTSKGQLTVPKTVRERLHLREGDRVDFQTDEKAEHAILTPVNRRVNEVFGLLAKSRAGQPVSVEDMDVGIARAVRRRPS
jgi:AbrB family looped-hinge helix DNA binding protein